MLKDKNDISVKDSDMEEKILIAAENLFLEKGFKATTTEIAKRAGCNQALVHYYFRTKEKLFEKVFESKLMIFADSFLSVDYNIGTFEERMRKRIGIHFDIMSDNPRLPIFIINELVSNPSRMATVKSMIGDMPEHLLEHLQEEIDREVAKGGIEPLSALDLFLNILSLNASMFIFYPMLKLILEKDESGMQALVTHRKEVIVETILNSLRKN